MRGYIYSVLYTHGMVEEEVSKRLQIPMPQCCTFEQKRAVFMVVMYVRQAG